MGCGTPAGGVGGSDYKRTKGKIFAIRCVRVWVAVSTCTGDKLQRTKCTHRGVPEARRVYEC